MSAGDLLDPGGAKRPSATARRLLLGLCVSATLATVGSLFLHWYGGVVVDPGAGLIGFFDARPRDAWSAVPGTAWMILAAGIATVTGIVIQAFARSRLAAGLTAFGVLAAVAVTVWRAADPPSHVYSGGSGPPTRALPLVSNGGETVALIAACVALIAATVLALAVAWHARETKSRPAPKTRKGP